MRSIQTEPLPRCVYTQTQDRATRYAERPTTLERPDLADAANGIGGVMGRWVELEIVGDGQTCEWEIEHGGDCALLAVQVWDTTGRAMAVSYMAAWSGDGRIVQEFADPPAAGVRLQVRVFVQDR